MSSKDLSDILDDISDAEVQILMLRKPTQLRKILDSIPKPARAVPRGGLPLWQRLNLDQKLPIPKIPPGKITFSRGFIGEDVRRTTDDLRPTFDLTDPFCRTVSYAYEALHDPHLAWFFAQLPARTRMSQLGFVTAEGRAVCSLKDFNTYRKYLYNRYMDRVHAEMKKLDTRAREDLTLLKVERDVTRRGVVYRRTERAREHMEAAARANADDEAEKKRLAKEKEAKVEGHVEYMRQLNERQRVERAARGKEKSERIKQRVDAAAELDLRRKITIIRMWRKNEKRRLQRLRHEAQEKKRKEDDEVNRKWQARINTQNNKITEDTMLLRLYTEDMTAGASRRQNRAEIKAYNMDLQLQRIRLTNWKEGHEKGKKLNLVRKIAYMFEKTQRGKYAVTSAQARDMARQALTEASSGVGSDRMAQISQARTRLELANTVPVAVARILQESLDYGIREFAKRRVALVLRDVEQAVFRQAARLLDHQREDGGGHYVNKRSRAPRRSIQLAAEVARRYASPVAQAPRVSVCFGATSNISSEPEELEMALRSVRDRVPTPVPSVTQLAEMIFFERKEDLVQPVALGTNMPERGKLVGSVNTLAKMLSRSVSSKVRRGLALDTWKVTMPKGYRHSMEFSETTAELAEAVIDGRLRSDCADVRRGADFLTRRVMANLIEFIKRMRQERKAMLEGNELQLLNTDFHAPGDYSPAND